MLWIGWPNHTTKVRHTVHYLEVKFLAWYLTCMAGFFFMAWVVMFSQVKSAVLFTKKVFRIRIGFSGDPDPDQCGSGSGFRSRILMTKNWKNLTAEKVVF